MEQRNYYAIIPATVRYDNNLPPNAKLLYGEITALCNEKGFCWAGNSYFSELYGVKKETVSRWISALERERYIIINIQYKSNSKEIQGRCITLRDIYPIDKIINPIDKIINTPCENSQYPIDKKVKDNNTVNNTINNKEIYKEKIPPTLSEVSEYCKERQNGIDPQAFINHYEVSGWVRGKTKIKSWKACVRTWENNKPKTKEYKLL